MLQHFLKFDKMITPSIIKLIWWVSSVICIIFGLFTFFGGIVSPYGGGFMVLGGLLTIVLGPFICRIYCELLIIMFKIYDSLQAIREEKKGV